MPKPIFIICSHSKAQDRFTNLLSIFEVIEGFAMSLGGNAETARRLEALEGTAGAPMALITFDVIATWMKEEDESPEDEFMYEVEMRPPGEDAKVLRTGTLRFEKQFHRIMIGIRRIAPWRESGMCEVEIRVRKRGSEPWSRQIYPIPITVHQFEPE